MSQVIISDTETTTDDESRNWTDTDTSHLESRRLLTHAKEDDPEEDSDETDFSMSIPQQIRRQDSEQSSSVSFKSVCSDSEQSDAVISRRRQKIFSVRLKTSEGTFGVSVNASNIHTFIENVKEKFHSKCQGKNIDLLLLEDDDIPLEEENLEFRFLKASKTINIKVESSPIKSYAKVKDLGKYICTYI